MLSFDTWW